MRSGRVWQRTLAGAGAVALLAACASKEPAFDLQKEHARNDLRQLSGALTQYRKECGKWPKNGEGLKALVERPRNGPAQWRPFLRAIPLDPWGHHYQYRFNPALDRVSIWSFGEDIVNTADDVRVDRLADAVR